MSTAQITKSLFRDAKSYNELLKLLDKTQEPADRDRILRKLIPLSDDRVSAQKVLQRTARGSALQKIALRRLFSLCFNYYHLRVALNFALECSTNPIEVLTIALADLKNFKPHDV